MRFPKRVRIGAVTYQIVWYDELEQIDDGKVFQRYGECVPQLGEIHLWRGMPVDMAWRVLLHEVLHAMAHEAAVDMEEAIPQHIDSVFLGFLLDNGFLTMDPFPDRDERARAKVAAKWRPAS